MDHLHALAGRLDATAAAVAGAARPLDTLHGDPRDLGGDAPGRPGEIGRALHAQWSAALVARAREAAGAGARLTAVAAGLRTAAEGYTEADAAAADRLGGALRDGPGGGA